jgi:hypothetical protein
VEREKQDVVFKRLLFFAAEFFIVKVFPERISGVCAGLVFFQVLRICGTLVTEF